MDNYKITIITVSYNAEKCIESAIQSVLLQTYKNIEYIIIDGLSTDGTLSLLQKYANRITKIISEKDSGIYNAMNKGVRNASGDILYFLNSDDQLSDPRVISDVISHFNNTSADIIHGLVNYVHVPAKFAGTHLTGHKGNRPMNSYRDILRYLLCHQACFCRRELFEKFGFLDERYRVAADFEWLVRVSKGGAIFSFLDRPVVDFNATGASSNLFKTFQETSRIVYEKYGLSDWVFFVSHRLANALKYYMQKVVS